MITHFYYTNTAGDGGPLQHVITHLSEEGLLVLVGRAGIVRERNIPSGVGMYFNGRRIYPPRERGKDSDLLAKEIADGIRDPQYVEANRFDGRAGKHTMCLHEDDIPKEL